MAGIDRFLPEWDANEVHQIVVPVMPERALAAALSVPAAPDAIVGALLRLRGLRREGSIEELLLGMGFQRLAHEPGEVVFGAAGRPWKPAGRLHAFDDAPAGAVRIAANFRSEPVGDGRALLSTETRIAAVDEEARRAFRRYWRVIGPFSALIRRRWLAAVRRSLDA